MVALATLYAGLFTFLAFRRYDSFGTWAFDMGNMDQAVWNTLAVSYLLFPSLEAVNTAEFHAVAVSAPLLLWAYYFARTDHWVAHVVASLLAMGTKEVVVNLLSQTWIPL